MPLVTLGHSSEIEPPPSRLSDIKSLVQRAVWLGSTAEEVEDLVVVRVFT